MANRYWNGSSSVNWTDNGNWEDTLGDPANAPTSSDDVFICSLAHTNSPTINAAAACKSLSSGGAYTTTLTLSSTYTLTVSGSVTFDSVLSAAGSGNLTVNTASATVALNGNTFGTVTLSEGVSITQSFTASSTVFTAAKTYTITSGITITSPVSGNGSNGNLVTLNASTTSTYHIHGTADVSYWDIHYCDASGYAFNAYTANGCVDGGNNYGVAFSVDRYWVGGAGNWSDIAKWASTTGGTAGCVLPSSANNVYIDANAGSGTITVGATAYCKDLIFTNSASRTFDLDYNIYVYGSWTGNSNVTVADDSVAGYVRFNGTGTHTITSAGKYLGHITYFEGSGTYTLQDALTLGSSDTIRVNAGTFNTGNYNITCGTFDCSATTARSITLGTSTLTLTNHWEPWSATGLTLSAASSTIKFGGLFYAYGKTYGTIEVTDSYGSFGSSATDLTCANLILFAGGETKFRAGQTYTITNSITPNGTAGNLVTLTSSSAGTHYHFALTNAADMSYWDIHDCTVTVSGKLKCYAANGCVDGGGNYAVEFSADRFWIGNGGNWNDTAHWASTTGGTGGCPMPTSTANVYFNANSFSSGSQTVTGNVTLSCKDFDWNNVTNSPTLNPNGYDVLCYGSTFRLSGMLFTSSAGANVQFYNTCSITTSAISVGSNMIFDGSAKTFTLQDDLTLASGRRIQLTTGTLDTNGKTVTAPAFYSNYSSTRTLTLGASTFNVTGYSAFYYPWNVQTATGFTLTANTGTIKITPYASDTYFYSGDKTYYNVEVAGTNTLIFGDSFTCTTLTLKAGATHKFNAGSTYTFTNLGPNGSDGSLVTIQSTSNGTHYHFVKTTGTISLSYWSIKDCYASGGATFQALTSNGCVDATGNDGWDFGETVKNVSDGLTPKIDETLALEKQFPVSDGLTPTITEGTPTFANIAVAVVDELKPMTTEGTPTFSDISVPVVDELKPKIDETVALTQAIPVVDELKPLITESTPTFANIAVAVVDELKPLITEGTPTFADIAVPVVDELKPKTDETVATSATVPVTETVSPALADSVSISYGYSLSDTLTPMITEDPLLAPASVPVVDELKPKTDETVAFANIAVGVSDTLLPKITDDTPTFSNIAVAVSDTLPVIADITTLNVEQSGSSDSSSSQFPAGNTSNSWTNPDKAYSDNTDYATAAPAKNSTVWGDWYNFSMSIPTGATIGTITIGGEYFVSTTASNPTFNMQLYYGTTARGTNYTDSTEPTSPTLREHTNTGTWTVSELNDNTTSGPRIRIGGQRGSSNSAVTFSLDYVKLTVAYTTTSETGHVLSLTDTSIIAMSDVVSVEADADVPKSVSDGLAVVITESTLSTPASMGVVDELKPKIDDAVATSATIPVTDELKPKLDESALSTPASMALTEDVNPKLDDVVSTSATVPVSDDLNPKIDDAVSTSASMSVTDGLAPKLEEGALDVPASMGLSDEMLPTVGDAVSVEKTSDETPVLVSDTIDVALTEEINSLSVSFSLSDTINLVITEGTPSFANISFSVTDGLLPTLSESVSTQATVPVSDGISLGTLTESLSIQATVPVSDTLSPTITETITDVTATIPVSDTLAVVITETVALNATDISVSDSIDIALSEAVTDLQVTLSMSDTSPPMITESVSVVKTVSIDVSDSMIVAASDSARVSASIPVSDDIVISESETLEFRIAVSDSANPKITESTLDMGSRDISLEAGLSLNFKKVNGVYPHKVNGV